MLCNHAIIAEPKHLEMSKTGRKRKKPTAREQQPAHGTQQRRLQRTKSPLERGDEGEISCADLPCSYTLGRSEGAQPWAREARQDLFTESRRENLGLLLHLARAAQEAWPSLGRWR